MRLMWNYRLNWFALVLLGLSGTRFVYSLFYAERPGIFLPFCLVGLCLFVLTWNRPFIVTYMALFILIVLAEGRRTIAASFLKRGRKHPEGSWIIGLGLVPTILAASYENLAALNLIPLLYNPLDLPVALFSLLSLAMSVSIYLARDFAQTNKDLEKQSTELQQLNVELEDRVKQRTEALQQRNEFIRDVFGRYLNR